MEYEEKNKRKKDGGENEIMKNSLKQSKGITLIALIITIIILVILAAVSINAIYNMGIVGHAINGTQQYAQGAKDENAMLDETVTKLEDAVSKVKEIQGGSTTPSDPADPETPAGPQVKVGNEYVTLTEDNVRNYMGKVVTNYKTPDTTETITIGENDYTVSTTYRIYYVDFNGDYGEEGTVYLKAECTANNYALQQDGAVATSKIYDLNPAIATNGPTETNNNMKVVIWLTDTAKWNALKTSTASSVATNTIQGKVKYVVGAPSVEMMMDSYNTYYSLSGTAPTAKSQSDATAENGGETQPRMKLFNQYTTGDYGYKVGPGIWSAYENYTTDFTVRTDSVIDTMYYPGNYQYYWLASPSAGSNDDSIVFSVDSNDGGFVSNGIYNANAAFCPLVSLSSDVQLEVR